MTMHSQIRESRAGGPSRSGTAGDEEKIRDQGMCARCAATVLMCLRQRLRECLATDRSCVIMIPGIAFNYKQQLYYYYIGSRHSIEAGRGGPGSTWRTPIRLRSGTS